MIDIVLFEGDPLLLECQATSAPPPQYTWYRGNIALDSIDRYDTSTPGRLRMTDVSRDQAGTYNCSVSSVDNGVAVGRNSTTARVFVIRKLLCVHCILCVSIVLPVCSLYSLYVHYTPCMFIVLCVCVHCTPCMFIIPPICLLYSACVFIVIPCTLCVSIVIPMCPLYSLCVHCNPCVSIVLGVCSLYSLSLK